MAPAFKLPRNLHVKKRRERIREVDAKWSIEEEQEEEVKKRKREREGNKRAEDKVMKRERETIESLVRNRLINSDLSEAWRAKILFNSPLLCQLPFSLCPEETATSAGCAKHVANVTTSWLLFPQLRSNQKEERKYELARRMVAN